MPNLEGVVEGFDQDFFYRDACFGPPFYLDVVKRVEKFKFDPKDIVLAAYPKTGNTWVEEIIWLICKDGDVESSSKTHIMRRFPLLELKYGDAPPFVEILEQTAPPRLINTHMPYHIVAGGLQAAKPKTIVLMRNPKDQLTSFFHFINSYPGRRVESFNDYFEMFKEGKLAFGNYIKHAAGWYQQIQQPHIFFITYEEIKADHRGSVARIAEFLGKTLRDDVIDSITAATSIAAMKKRSVSKGALVESGQGQMGDLKHDVFFRKGVVGDWKNLFREKHNREMDELCQKHLEPLGLKFKFE